MILSILFMLMILICVAALLFFLFFLFLPSLKAQDVNTANPLFSRAEFAAPASRNAQAEGDGSRKAVVLCSSKKPLSENHLTYTGLRDCRLFMSLYDGPHTCIWSCIGFGSCRNACPQQAIVLENGTAVVTAACNGCGACVSSCPRQLIRLVPRRTKELVPCAAPEGETGCPEYRKSSNISEKRQKCFQFWQKCYRLLHGAKEQ